MGLAATAGWFTRPFPKGKIDARVSCTQDGQR
jgi:hypothetical protein